MHRFWEQAACHVFWNGMEQDASSCQEKDGRDDWIQ